MSIMAVILAENMKNGHFEKFMTDLRQHRSSANLSKGPVTSKCNIYCPNVALVVLIDSAKLVGLWLCSWYFSKGNFGCEKLSHHVEIMWTNEHWVEVLPKLADVHGLGKQYTDFSYTFEMF